MTDVDFGRFGTELGFARKVLKHQKVGAIEVIEATDHRKIDRAMAIF